jgi:hypothetical protein
MSAVSFTGLLIISVIAVVTPVAAASIKPVKVPSAVVEIVAGIAVGPSLLGWVKIDQPIDTIALRGLAFLLFLAGLEIDLRGTTATELRARCYRSGSADAARSRATDPATTRAYPAAILGLRRCTARANQGTWNTTV